MASFKDSPFKESTDNILTFERLVTKTSSHAAQEQVKKEKKAVIVAGRVALNNILRGQTKYPLDLESFRAFLKTVHSEENLNFLLVVMNDLLNCNDPKCYQDTVRFIIDRHFAKDAPEELNAPEKMMSNVLSSYEAKLKDAAENGKMDKTLFAEVFNFIYKDLHLGAFANFRQKVIVTQQLDLANKIALWWIHRPTLKEFFSFPNPVNEVETRLHFMLTTILVVFGILMYYFYEVPWVFVYTTYGHFARVLCGPRLDPQAYFVLFVLGPIARKYEILKDNFIPGPPRRFAQAMGFCFSLATFLFFYFKISIGGYIAVGMYLFATSLAFFFNICLGCTTFSLLMKMHMVPKSICEACEVSYMKFDAEVV